MPAGAADRSRPRPAAAAIACLLLAGLVRLAPSAAGGVAGSHAVALAGALAAPLATLVAVALSGPRAGAWAGLLVALSPIHALASRAGGPEPVLVLSLLVALWLAVVLERHGHGALAGALGLALGGLVAMSAAPAFAAVALVIPAWLGVRRERRALAALTLLVAIALAAAAAYLGFARSPLDYGVVPSWIPETTSEGMLRCAGASFTRLLGLEYQLVVPHARDALPLTTLFLALMARGARALPSRSRALLVAGAALPFVFAAAMALASGRVTPLQASRLLAALPFVVLLLAAGLGSLRGRSAWAAGGAVLGALAVFLSLSLAR
jgi:hypothetical protein